MNDLRKFCAGFCDGEPPHTVPVAKVGETGIDVGDQAGRATCCGLFDDK
jgi:hypothetical protein